MRAKASGRVHGIEFSFCGCRSRMAAYSFPKRRRRISSRFEKSGRLKSRRSFQGFARKRDKDDFEEGNCVNVATEEIDHETNLAWADRRFSRLPRHQCPHRSHVNRERHVWAED